MNRQQAKELFPIIQAFVEGKTIEARTNSISKWIETTTPTFDSLHEYRIKPEPKYRPFANKEECWQEMLKHQPFGWVKAYNGQFVITEIRDSKATIGTGRNNNFLSYDYIFKEYTFADGTLFGIKE